MSKRMIGLTEQRDGLYKLPVDATLERLLAILERLGVFVVTLTLFVLPLNARAEWLVLLLKIILISLSSLIVTSFLIFLFMAKILLGLERMMFL